jgi:hypothetical protein
MGYLTVIKMEIEWSPPMPLKTLYFGIKKGNDKNHRLMTLRPMPITYA